MPLVVGKQTEGQLKGVKTPMRRQINTPSVIVKKKNYPTDLIIINNEPLVSSIHFAKRLGVRPRHTFRLIQKYQSEIKGLRVLRFKNAKKDSLDCKKGRGSMPGAPEGGTNDNE